MVCPSCGSQITDGSPFCFMCGATISKTITTAGSMSTTITTPTNTICNDIYREYVRKLKSVGTAWIVSGAVLALLALWGFYAFIIDKEFSLVVIPMTVYACWHLIRGFTYRKMSKTFSQNPQNLVMYIDQHAKLSLLLAILVSGCMVFGFIAVIMEQKAREYGTVHRQEMYYIEEHRH